MSTPEDEMHAAVANAANGGGPDAMVLALEHVAAGLDGVRDIACQFQKEIRRIDRKRVRQLVIMAIGFTMLLGALLFIAVGNRVIFNQIAGVITPGEPAYERTQESTRQLVGGLVVEQDCRTRRALAGLAPPDPGPPEAPRSCASQTPAEVWPPA